MICNSVDHPPVYNWAFISFHFVQSEYSPTFIMMMIMVMIMMMIMVMMMRMIMTTMMMMMRMKVGIGLNCNGQRCNCSGESPRFGSIIPIKLSLDCFLLYSSVFLYFCIHALAQFLSSSPSTVLCSSVFLYSHFGSIPIKLSLNSTEFLCNVHFVLYIVFLYFCLWVVLVLNLTDKLARLSPLNTFDCILVQSNIPIQDSIPSEAV